MAETPLLTCICSISPRTFDKDGNARTFTIHAGNTGGFSANVLKPENMPISKVGGKYLMIFDQDKLTLTIKKAE